MLHPFRSLFHSVIAAGVVVAGASLLVVSVVAAWPLSASSLPWESGDAAAREVAQALQAYHEKVGAFPDTLALEEEHLSVDGVYLAGLLARSDIDLFSNAGPDEFFVYFRSNSKLRVFPDRYEVYPRR